MFSQCDKIHVQVVTNTRSWSDRGERTLPEQKRKPKTTTNVEEAPIATWTKHVQRKDRDAEIVQRSGILKNVPM